MLSLKDKFAEICLRLGQGRRLESTGSDPIYYLVFPVGKSWRSNDRPAPG